ncbi:MAG: prolyl oligopeptidase family serine peptidase [Nitriliruptorales bacterium]|nr:prolyl oligopeptidase family serine peptidase [Nitriliruptorales bacterium]
MPEVFVVVGSHVRLDRPGLSAPAPRSVENLLRLCAGWAREVGWTLGTDPRAADALVVGPGIDPPPVTVPIGLVQAGQGADGFRWAIRHVAFHTAWPAEVIAYGTGEDHVADVRRPDGDHHGTAVLLHGGFWMDAWRRNLMDGVAVDLSRRGWTTWNVEYRRVGAGGGWPATANDVLAAVDFIAAGAAGAPLLLVGHSAGAQLALWACGERSDRIDRVVSLAGICDIEAAARQRLGGGAASRLLDGEPPAVASPLDRLPLRVPALVAHAVGDPVVPVDHSRRYVQAAQHAGDTVHYLEVEGDDHMTLIDPGGTWPEIAARF